MIEPALTPDEWAKLRIADRHGEGIAIEDGGLWAIAEGGSCGVPLTNRLGVAALALHGRITWEMVDALRNGAALEEGRGPTDGMDAKIINAVADLLESLLPPRTT